MTGTSDNFIVGEMSQEIYKLKFRGKDGNKTQSIQIQNVSKRRTKGVNC